MKRIAFALLGVTIILHAQEKEETQSKTSDQQATISVQDITRHAHYWAPNLPKLTTPEYELLLNLLYFNALTNFYEQICGQTLITIHTQEIKMNKLLVSNEAESRAVARAITLLLKQLKDEYLPLRAYASKSNAACLKMIENSEFKTLKDIVMQLKEYSRAIYKQCAKQNKPAIRKNIENTAKILPGCHDALNGYAQTLTAILEDKNPQFKEGLDGNVLDLELAITTANQILGLINELSLYAISLKEMSIETLGINSAITTNFYTAYYDTLAKSKSLPIHIMFDENGLIDPEKRDEFLEPLDDTFIIHKKHYGV
jgi:hypothetical protein